MNVFLIIFCGFIVAYLFVYIISKSYQTRFERDFKKIIYSRLKLNPKIEYQESDISKFLKEAIVNYKHEVINEYSDSLIDGLLDSKGYSNFCTVVYNDLMVSSDDKGVFLLKLNSFINDNFSFLSTNNHWIGLYNFFTKQFRQELINKFDDSHDFKDELYYEENKKSGVVTRWYDDGTIMEKISYKNGIEIKIESWYSNGKKEQEGEKKNNEWYKYYRNWDINGQIIEELITDKYQQITKWSHWYKNGQLSWENNYKDNLNHGINISYRETGELQSLEPWFKDKRHGKCLYHYNEFPFKINNIVNYKHGLMHGKYKCFNSKGELFYETNFVNGTGLAKDCDKYYGFLEYVHKYINGVLVHEQVFYKNGQLEMETFWENDKIVSETFWDEKGILKKER